MPIPIEPRPSATNGLEALGHKSRLTMLVWLALSLAGCGEPSVRDLKNRRELEALLTAIALKNKKELARDIQRIEDRRASGELPEASYKDLCAIIKKAQDGDWVGAEKQAYELREAKPFLR